MTTVSENALAELNVSMNADIKQRWVEALRSGQYKQSQGHLRINNAYCCLGVLCELHRQDFPSTAWKQDDETQSLFGFGSTSFENYPPSEVLTWANLDSTACEILADANDSGADFPTIASLIEKML